MALIAKSTFRALQILSLGLMAGTLIAQSQGDQDGRKPDLKLELTSSEKHCPGSDVPLKLNITNQSEHVVRIFKLSLWHTSYFEHTDIDGKSVKGTLFLEPDRRKVGLPENTITLEPKDSYSTTREASEFSSEGKHKLAVSYGGATSNEITFEVAVCN
jgi:hypothetical protein